MPRKYEANLIVIGAGSAGLVSAYIGAAVNAKVILIEKHKMGGDCLNTGCVPSKALLKSAKVASLVQNHASFGLELPASAPSIVNFPAVMQRVHRVISDIAPHDSVERYTELGVECVQGEAVLLDAHTVKVGERTMTGKNIILAAGARPFVPPIPGIQNVDYLTSDSVWGLEELPENLVVLGGGPIGCELSQAFSKLGSKVTTVELAPQLMGREDKDVASLIQEDFTKSGINVLVNHKAVEVQAGKVICEKSDGTKVEVPFNKLLVAVGRKANSDRIPGLEKLGVELNRNGTIAVDAYLRSKTVPSIYACGDIAGPYQFTHTASHQAWYCAVNALFGPFKRFKVNYDVIPWATFTSPEVARVGMNEAEAAQTKGLDYQVSTYGMDDLDRAICDGTAHGFVKVITKKGTDKILGVTIVHEHASDLIAEYVLAMKQKIGLNKIMGTIHLYPSNAEANKYVAGVWKKQNKPEGMLNVVKKFHDWRLS